MQPIFGQDTSPSYQPPPSVGQIFDAGFDESFKNTLSMTVVRDNIVNDAMKSGPIVDIESLNKEFPGLNAKEPRTRLWAQQQMDSREETRKNQDILNRASGLWQNSVSTASSLIGALSDPVETTIGMVLGAGIGNIVRGGKAVTKLTPVFLENLAGNVIENTANEMAVSYVSAKEEVEHTASQALTNVLVSSVFGAAISSIPTALSLKFGKLGEVNERNALEMTKIALEQGKNPNSVLGKLDEKIDADFKIDENIRPAIKDSFVNKNAKELLGNSEDFPTLFKNIKQGLDSGEVTMDEVSSFKSLLENSGFDRRKYYMADPDSSINLKDSDALEITNELNNPENDINFDAETEQILKAPSKTIDSIQAETLKLDTDEINVINKNLDELEMQGKITKEQRMEFASPKEEKQAARFEALKELRGCAGI